MVKRVLAFATALMLSLSMSMPSFASVATPSNADLTIPALFDASESISMYSTRATALPTISNTVDMSDVRVYYRGYLSDGSTVNYSVACNEDGTFTRSTPQSDIVKVHSIYVYLNKAVMPSSGTYDLKVQFRMDHGPSSYPNGAYTYWKKSINNAETLYGEFDDECTLNNYNGDVQVNAKITIGNVDYLQIGVWYPDDGDSYLAASGQISVNWSTSTSGSGVSIGSVVNDITLSDDVANNTADMAEGIEEMSSGISAVADAVNDLAAAMEPHYNNVLTQLHHITEQLHAFWDQLAAMYNDTILPHMTSQTDRIVDALGNMTGLGSTVNSAIDRLIASDSQKFGFLKGELVNNADKNTDQVVNGYDDSSLTSENDKLSDAITEYEEVEKELFDQASDNLSSFEFQNPFDQFTAPLADISYFLNGIYYGLGSFNIAIGFSLTLAIALLCIGWYRFRGG